MSSPIHRLARLLQPFVTEGCEAIEVAIIQIEQTAEITICRRTREGDLISVKLPDEVATAVLDGCHELCRHFDLMCRATSTVGLRLSADRRSTVWAQCDPEYQQAQTH